MKLTLQQITLLKRCVSDSASRYQKTADWCIGEEPKARWQQEATSAHQLLALLDDALFISVEPMKRTPPGEACGDIHCHGQHHPKVISVGIGEVDLAAQAGLTLRPKPSLLITLDACGSTYEARDILRGSSRPDLLAVASFLNVHRCDLLDTITRRTRDRLLKAA